MQFRSGTADCVLSYIRIVHDPACNPAATLLQLTHGDLPISMHCPLMCVCAFVRAVA